LQILNWLGENVAVAQFFAYLSLTVTTAIVAILSLKFSFRQHYGWKPILLFVNRGISSVMRTENSKKPRQDSEPGIYAWVTFELWNRRTYPIVVEKVLATFSQDILDRSKEGQSELHSDWILLAEGHRCRERFVIENGKHHRFDLYARMKDGQSQNIQDTFDRLDLLDGAIEIKITYFDPRRKRLRKIATTGQYSFRD